MPTPAGKAGAAEVGYADRHPAYTAPMRPAQALRCNISFRRLTEHVHRLGPRPCAEAMLEIADGRDPLEVLERYAQLDPYVRAFPEAKDWPPLPIARVA